MSWRNQRSRRLKHSGSYNAWIAASDLPDENHKTRPSAHAWKIQHISNGDTDQAVYKSDRVKSSQNKGYVTAAYRVIQAAPDHSSVHIISKHNYIVLAITKWLPKWRQNGWRKSNGKPVEYKEIWQAIDHLCEQRGLLLTAKRPEDAENIKIIDQLREIARAACRGRASELGLPTARRKHNLGVPHPKRSSRKPRVGPKRGSKAVD